jgi:hypothetical protein
VPEQWVPAVEYEVAAAEPGGVLIIMLLVSQPQCPSDCNQTFSKKSGFPWVYRRVSAMAFPVRNMASFGFRANKFCVNNPCTC